MGSTAAVARALTDAGINCNVVCNVVAVRYDHLFVPLDRAEDAMDALRQQGASQRSPNLEKPSYDRVDTIGNSSISERYRAAP